MSSPGRPPKKEEHAPSLFGWLRSATAKTRDDAEVNPRIGQVNVGVSQPRRRTLRIPRGAVAWLITLAVIALLAAVVVPAVGGFIDGFGDAFEEAFDEGGGSDQSELRRSEAERPQRRARRMIQGDSTGNSFSLADCVTQAAGDPAAVSKCNEQLLKEIDVPSTPSEPGITEFDELDKMSECIDRAGSDLNRIVECTSQ